MPTRNPVIKDHQWLDFLIQPEDMEQQSLLTIINGIFTALHQRIRPKADLVKRPEINARHTEGRRLQPDSHLVLIDL